MLHSSCWRLMPQSRPFWPPWPRTPTGRWRFSPTASTAPASSTRFAPGSRCWSAPASSITHLEGLAEQLATLPDDVERAVIIDGVSSVEGNRAGQPAAARPRRLRQHPFLPVVPRDTARLRLQVPAAHQPEEIDHLLTAPADVTGPS